MCTINAENRLKTAVSEDVGTVEYVQDNRYNGFGQRVSKTETEGGVTDTVNYFYDGSSVLYTTDAEEEITAFNLIGAEDNILSTARPSEGGADLYVYTKDIRESTINMVGSDGTAPVSYDYTDYGETEVYGEESFFNEICYTGGIYDDTTGLYYLNARYYSPENGAFLTQDTYRGDRSRTATINLYAYCAGNPIGYTDPSGHAIWGIIGAAMGAYDGYKYAKKKKLTGWKKVAAIAGGAQGYEGKQFANDFDEVLNFANKPFNKHVAAIFKVRIPKSVYNMMDHTDADSTIFGKGIVTVPKEKLDYFNQNIISLEHCY